MSQLVETHPVLRRLARFLLAFPLAKTATRRAARLAIQRLPVSRKNKRRIYNMFAADAAAVQPVTCNVTMPGGGRLSLELDLTDELSRNWYYWGYSEYERGTVFLWTHLLNNVTTVFDIGANVGVYTLLAAARLQGHGQVHAFEPNPDVFPWLARNAERNCFAHARLVQLALSDFDGDANFFLPKNGAWTNGSLIEGFADQGIPQVIETMRFDTYCSKFGIEKVDLIKIDVEGAELKVLNGMGALLEKWKPDIICEVLEGYTMPLNTFFNNTSYIKYIITPEGLRKTDIFRADPEFRDYYLTCAPVTERTAS
jgi:FkbM family methyltransferase